MWLSKRRGNNRKPAIRKLFRPQLEALEARTLLTAGDLDATFGVAGLAAMNFTGSMADQGQAVALQPDGKIVVVGQVLRSLTGYDFGVARFNANGTPDATFGTNGRVTTFIGTSNEFAQGVLVQPDGKIVVVGYAFLGATGFDMAVVRYNSDGTLDSTFGSGGQVTIAFSGNSFDAAHGVALQADGKLIVAGYSASPSTGNDFALARLNSNGTFDASFGLGGLVRSPVSSANDQGYAVAVQADGKILLAGVAFLTSNDFAVMRYHGDGQIDTTFGTLGAVIVNFNSGTQDVASAIALQADGKIVLAGYSYSGAYDFALLRLNANGTLDTGFDGDGKVVTNFSGGSADIASGVVALSGGRILAGGFSNAAGTGNDFALVRYNNDGSLDTTFGSGGRVTTNFGGTSNDIVKGMAVQPGGNIVLAGYSNYAGTGDDFAVARYIGDSNQPPVANAGGPYTVAEGASVALDGSASSDPNQPGSTLLYEWDLDGDGVFGETGEVGVQPIFSAAGLDGPSSVIVWLRVTDNGGLSNMASATINVTNVAPSADAGPDFAVNEGAGVSLSATVTDPGPDTFTFLWHVASSNGQLTADGNGPTFSFTPNDNGTYTVTFTVTDDDGGVGSDTVVITVNNVAPTVDAGPDVTVNEGDTVDLSGTFSDPGADTWTFNWHVVSSNGQVVADGSGQSFSFTPDDNGTYTVTFTVTDDDGGVGSDTVVVTVNNVAPMASVSGPVGGVPGLALTFNLSATDPGAADVAPGFTYTIDWGDGSPVETTSSPAVTHAFAQLGSYTVHVTATDKDGGVSGVATTTVNIAAAQLVADPLSPGKTMLLVGGTTGDDGISFQPGRSPGTVVVRINGVVTGTFAPTSRIVAYGGSGNDVITVSKRVTLSAWLNGGDGDDVLRGGSGNDVLLGGAGNDVLVGGTGRNILIGGAGQDQLRGRGDDVLVGGSTAHDANDAALAALLAEWSSSASYAQRVAHLSGTSGGGLNGNVVLRTTGPGATVFDDQVRDLLFANSGRDWALPLGNDKVK